MANTCLVKKADDTMFMGMDSNGKKTLKRTIIFNNPNKISQAVASNDVLIPTIHQCHPDNALYVVDSISEMEYFDEPPQYKIEVTYVLNTETTDNGGTRFSRGKRPWELGPQNFQKTTYDKQIPMTRIFTPKSFSVGGISYTGDSQWHGLRNSAGCRITATKTVTVMRISFEMNKKHTSGTMKLENSIHRYNCNSEKVCGIVIEPYAGKLMPFSSKVIQVYKSDGTLDYEYENATVSIEILEHETWASDFLDVGTMCLWKDPTSETEAYTKLGAIYKYKDLSSITNPENFDAIAKAPVVYGSIEDACLCRAKFIKNCGSQYASTFSYEEVTEPMPLDIYGRLANDLLKKDAEYRHVAGFERQGESWSQFNLPEQI